jgi:predicted aminopeptidase
MLRHDDVDLVALILHELSHGTVFASGKGDWNEAMATFVGEAGAVQFFVAKYGEASREVTEARARLEDVERVDAFTRRVQGRLAKLYAGGRAAAEVLILREQVWAEARDEFSAVRRTLHDDVYEAQFRGRLNNAEVQAQRRYGRLDVFRAAYETAGRDWGRFFAAMREAAAAGDPFRALER